jgi:acyl dehydratase
MRLMVAERRRQAEAAHKRGESVAAMGPALGLRDLKWLKPVFVDDTVTYESEVVETRLSESRPNLGLLTIRSTGVNQRGELVISFVSTTFVERRPVNK